MKTLGLAIITKNEELNIKRCLDSVSFATSKVVVDSHSNDQTVQIAKSLGANVILKEWEGYPTQKKFALEQLKTDWILILDADEALTSEAEDEIKKIIEEPHSFDAYRIPRYQVFMGKTLKHGKGVDSPIRLIRRGKGKYTDREVHEEIITQGRVGNLKFGMEHFSSVTIMDRYEKIKRDISLETQYLSNEPISLMEFFGNPLRYFFSYYLKGCTWKDGIPGLIWLILFTFQVFIQNALQYEKNLKKN